MDKMCVKKIFNINFLYMTWVCTNTPEWEKEVGNKTANVRTRDNKVHDEHSIEKIIERFAEFKKSKCLDSENF
jgi:hypothetical protein